MDILQKVFFGICGLATVVAGMLVYLHLFPRTAVSPAVEESIVPTKEETLALWAEKLSWVVATTSASWAPRDSAGSFVFGEKMWTMGGLDGNGTVDGQGVAHYWQAKHFNDIWSSEDGAHWKLEKAYASWSPRRSMSVVHFKDALWMFGGFSPTEGYSSDVWKSDDGKNWTKVIARAPWPVREGQTAEVFGGKMWMMGGVNYSTREIKNDIWYSEDGLVWTEATTTVVWSPRWDHATAVLGNKLYLTGGMNLKLESYSDVWVTEDGVEWEQLLVSAPWQSRQGHMLLTFKDRLWSIGRLNDAESGGANDIWYSADGLNWQKTDTDPMWLGREDHSALVFKDRLFVFGGMDANWHWQNDVWVSAE